MSADRDIGLDEKRVYEGDERETTVYVASESGVVAVSVVADRVGGFEIVTTEPAMDVSAGVGGVAVATSDGVRFDDGDGFDAIGLADVTAVSVHGTDVLATVDEGTVSQYRDGDWTTVGSLSGVTGMDGDLLASDEGVYRVLEDGLRHVGLGRAVDVAASGVPLAATADGLYQLGNGWLEVAEGEFRFVASDPGATAGALGRAHAGTDDALLGHHDGPWQVETSLDNPLVDVAYGDSVYAVSTDGRFVAESPDDWRHRNLGVRGVTAAAAHPETD